mgnify:CR=1 FL=1
MTNSKIKPELNGVAETMLLTFYARIPEACLL